MKRFGTAVVTTLLALSVSSGCGGIFAASDVTEPRYFAPSTPAREKAASARPEGAVAPVKLRIGRVSSGEHLRQRIVFRASPVEVGEYENFRWTEKPEEYVRRALLRSLFEERGITQAVGGTVPTVDVEVLAFEEVRRGDKRAARVEISYAVRDDRVVVAAHTVVVERDAGATDDMQRIVEAMAAALDEASSTIATEVTKALDDVRASEQKAADERAKEEAAQEESDRTKPGPDGQARRTRMPRLAGESDSLGVRK